MMQLLIPLGLLGLLSIIMLIIIYIIKPNYLVRHVSSTYVWKLSLKYRRKKLPTSTIRNILLFLCQLLILTAIALILSKPALVYDTNRDESEVIAIIDSSASMYTKNNDGETRFSRALDRVVEQTDKLISGGGTASVILSDETPDFLGRQITLRNRSELTEALDSLRADENACSYGTANVEATMKLCEDILATNPAAKIYYYTDTAYSYVPSNVNIVSVADTDEWNAAVLGAETEFVDGSYVVTAQVACYGRDMLLDVSVTVTNANAGEDGAGETITFTSAPINCNANSTKTVIFRFGSENTNIDSGDYFYNELTDREVFTSYETVTVSVEVNDSFADDNAFYIYDGRREVIRVQYASSDPNPFFTSALDVLRNAVSPHWDVRVDEVYKEDAAIKNFATSGYDFYIFEHVMPDQVPSDGAVLLSDPLTEVPDGTGLIHRGVYGLSQPMPLSLEEAHPVTRNVIAEDIEITRFTALDFGPDYQVLLSCGSVPVFLIRNEGAEKVAVMPFSVHFSNIVETPDWIILIYNLFDYFFPATVSSNVLEVNGEVVLQARGPEIKVRAHGDTETYTEFPASLHFAVPGTVVLDQTSYFPDKDLPSIRLFVKVPQFESNVWRQEDALPDLYLEEEAENSYDDLLIYLAAALVALLFIEWWLQSRENR